MLGAFDDVVHHQAVRQMGLLMRAEAVGRKKLIVRRAIDRKAPPSMVEADHILRFHVIFAAGFDPLTHNCSLQLDIEDACYSAAALAMFTAWNSSRDRKS